MASKSTAKIFMHGRSKARRRGATLVTDNVREFRRVPGLSVEDWARP